MRFLLTSDWHITNAIPRCRTQDYPQQMERKIQQIINATYQFNVEYVLHAGDITDSPRIPYETTRKYINELHRLNFTMFTVPGQHDLRYHTYSTINDTAMLTMEAAVCFKVLSNIEPDIMSDRWNYVRVYGCGFGQKIPIPCIDHDPTIINILVIHKLVSNKDYWNGTVNYTSAMDLLTAYNYDLIVSGDNHKQFSISTLERSWTTKKYIVNPGSLMRSRSDQSNHKPAFYIFDTETKSLTRHQIDTEPWENVYVEGFFDEPEDHVHAERISSLIETLQSESISEELGLDFVENLRNLLISNNVSESMIELTETIIQKCQRKLNADQ